MPEILPPVNPTAITKIDEVRTSNDNISQQADIEQTFVSGSDVKAQQFETMLNEQQQITELRAKQENAVFDPAQDIEENATFSQPAQTAQL